MKVLIIPNIIEKIIINIKSILLLIILFINMINHKNDVNKIKKIVPSCFLVILLFTFLFNVT